MSRQSVKRFGDKDMLKKLRAACAAARSLVVTYESISPGSFNAQLAFSGTKLLCTPPGTLTA